MQPVRVRDVRRKVPRFCGDARIAGSVAAACVNFCLRLIHVKSGR